MNRASPRTAFTLWEVLLAMTIAAVILAALGMAIDLHLRVVDTGRGEVEQSLLARSVLERIADDLHSAVLYQPIDMEALLEEAMPKGATQLAAQATSSSSSPSSSSSQSSSQQSSQQSTRGSTGSSTPSGGGTTGASGQGATAGASGAGGSSAGQSGASGTQSATDDAEAAAHEAASAPAPGVYGTQTELAVDVSRLPRLDQYQQLMAGGDQPLADRVSDVKTVTYFVQNANSVPSGAAGPAVGGLMRQERDRAASIWSSQQGGGDASQAESLAPEVVALEFRYFDGQEWSTDWDSDVRQGLPIAIEVAVAVASPSAEIQPERLGSLSAAAPPEEAEYQIYRLLVHLPSARATTLETTEETTDEESSDSEEDSSP